MELKKLTIDSPDIPALEEINEEAIPDCERNSFTDLMNTGATILGIYEDRPVGCLDPIMSKSTSIGLALLGAWVIFMGVLVLILG